MELKIKVKSNDTGFISEMIEIPPSLTHEGPILIHIYPSFTTKHLIGSRRTRLDSQRPHLRISGKSLPRRRTPAGNGLLAKPIAKKQARVNKPKTGTRELKNLSSSINYEKRKLLKGGPSTIK